MIWKTLSITLAASLAVQVAFAADSLSGRSATSDTQDLLYLADECPIIIRLHIRVDGQSYEDVWNEHVERYFDDLDKNDDQVLSASEAGALPKPPADADEKKSPVDRVKSFFQSFGSNSAEVKTANTNMTKEDVAQYLRRIDEGPFSVKTARRTSALAAMGGSMGQNGTETVNLLERLDNDRSGQLSLSELQSAGTVLYKLDLDDDETISAEELQTSNPYAAFLPTQNQQITNTQSPFIRLDFANNSAHTPLQLAGRILRKYDAAKSDHRLSREEIHFSEPSFQRFDEDSDGLLDRSELARLLEHPDPTLELMVRIGEYEKAETPLSIVKSNIDPSAAVTIRKTVDGAPTIVSVGQQVDVAVDKSRTGIDGVKTIVRGQFAATDKDNNGYLEMKEITGGTQWFKQADHDRDGKVFQTELLAHIDDQMVWAQSRTVLNVFGPNRNLFEILDLNGDRRLGQRELASGLGQFAVWDTNGDKHLDSSEVPRQYRLAIGHGTPEIGELSAFLAVQDIYGPTAQTKGSTEGPRWFQRMDQNRDGDVSRREFLFSAASFDNLDENHDDLIDAAEASRSP